MFKCKCSERVNKELAKKNTVLDTMVMVTMETGKTRQAYQIATTRRGSCQSGGPGLSPP